VDPVPDPLLRRKSGRAGKRNRDLWICSQKELLLLLLLLGVVVIVVVVVVVVVVVFMH
jgi:hypothetical protein